MQGFVRESDRQQTTLFPECLDDWVDEGNSIRAVDVFVDALELRDLGFDGVDPAATGRPAYHPSPMLKLYIYGYLTPASPFAWAECRAAMRPRGGVTPPKPRQSARGNSGRRSFRWQQ